MGASTANFTNPAAISANALGRLTILDAGNPAWNPATPLATPYEYADYTTNTVGTNTISGMTRGVANTTAKSFSAGAIVAQGFLAEDIYASVPWKFDEQSPTSSSVTIPASGSIPASYLGINWRNLRIVITGRTALAATLDAIGLRFNLDSGSSYTWSALAATSASPTGVVPTGATSISIGQLPAASAPANLPGEIEIVIPEFANTSFLRIARSIIGAHGGGSAFEDAIFHGNWNSTAALTSVTIFAAGAFVSGSRVSTYLEP